MSDSRIDQIAKLKQAIATLEEQQRALGVDLSLSLNQMRELLAQLGAAHDDIDRVLKLTARLTVEFSHTLATCWAACPLYENTRQGDTENAIIQGN